MAELSLLTSILDIYNKIGDHFGQKYMRNIQCELFRNTKIFSPIYHLGFNNSDLKQLARFFLKFVDLCTIFFSLFFSCANFFLVFAQPSPQKFNGPSLINAFQTQHGNTRQQFVKWRERPPPWAEVWIALRIAVAHRSKIAFVMK